IVAFLGASTAGAGVAHADRALPMDNSIADVAERVVESVVNIDTESQVATDPFFVDMFGADEVQKMAGKGSGVIVTANGRILTNAHVINGADTIMVTLHDGTEVKAKLVGKDTKADLAVLQLEGKFGSLKPLPMGDSSQTRLGELVLAIGDGLGIGKSVSLGIVSAKGRGLKLAEYEDFIQTDAAINPGNSGGALVNMKGELVGINTAIASRTGGYQGIGFAIPTNMAKPIMEALMKDGKVTRGYMGIGIATVSPPIAKKYGLGAQQGVLVASVEASGPAAKAGLVEGDVITSFNGNAVKSDDVLRNQIAALKPGSTVEVAIAHRDGKTATVKAKLGELKDEEPPMARSKKQRQQQPQRKSQQWQWQSP
ncbi:MAG TPA: trypsin-like peptidase domain-containing protein, partial [Kofleriaceae bacterium]|nr:trypsin-like peptidase domain-containing protein [Kofleriaceae bacterium]